MPTLDGARRVRAPRWHAQRTDASNAHGVHLRANATGLTLRVGHDLSQVGGGDRFGFTGQLLEQEAPRRAVTTEQMIGVEGPPNKNELVLAPRPGNRTLVEVRIEYPSKEVRDLVLGTGMVDGMEVSYARLERLVA